MLAFTIDTSPNNKYGNTLKTYCMSVSGVSPSQCSIPNAFSVIDDLIVYYYYSASEKEEEEEKRRADETKVVVVEEEEEEEEAKEGSAEAQKSRRLQTLYTNTLVFASSFSVALESSICNDCDHPLILAQNIKSVAISPFMAYSLSNTAPNFFRAATSLTFTGMSTMDLKLLKSASPTARPTTGASTSGLDDSEATALALKKKLAIGLGVGGAALCMCFCVLVRVKKCYERHDNDAQDVGHAAATAVATSSDMGGGAYAMTNNIPTAPAIYVKAKNYDRDCDGDIAFADSVAISMFNGPGGASEPHSNSAFDVPTVTANATQMGAPYYNVRVVGNSATR